MLNAIEPVGALTATTHFSYDSFNKIRFIRYPDQEFVTWDCDHGGALRHVAETKFDPRHRSNARTYPMMNEREIRALLSKLCVKLGFCLPPLENQRIVDDPPQDARSFTDAVFRGEGMNPDAADRGLYRDVLHVVSAAFARAADRQFLEEQLRAQKVPVE